MKRDMELIRSLLLEKEQERAPEELAGYSLEEILYNTELMADAGLVVASFIKDAGGVTRTAITERLTWAGHDFLDSTRDSKIWKKAKEQVLKSGASWTFDILREWVKYELKQKLGLPHQ
jgi:hypothetical protein